MEAAVIRMNGQQMRQSGNSTLTDAISSGMVEGKSRAEMRQEIERLNAENLTLRRRLRQVEESWEKERRNRMNADIECRAKSKALIEMRRGHAGTWAQLLELASDRKRKMDRFLTVVAAVTSLGAVALICMAILVFVG